MTRQIGRPSVYLTLKGKAAGNVRKKIFPLSSPPRGEDAIKLTGSKLSKSRSK